MSEFQLILLYGTAALAIAAVLLAAAALIKSAGEKPPPVERAERLKADIERLAAEMESLAARIDDRADKAVKKLESALEPAGRRKSRPDCAGPVPGGPYPAAPPSRADEILHLASLGAQAQEIAARLGVPAGEVELVLNLHRMAAPGRGS